MKFLSFLFSLSTLIMAQSNKNTSELKASLEAIINSHKGTFAVAFLDLNDGHSVFINEKENFHAASTMKTPVMVEIFKQADAHLLSLEDSVTVVNSFKSIIDSSEYSLSLSDDSEDGLYSSIGKNETIGNLLFKMITVSSNLATNILIGIVGPDNIMRTMKELGLNDIRVLRGVEDGKAYDVGKNNTTTAFDLSLLFTKIARNEIVSKEACTAMVNVLKAQRFKSMIPAMLPSDVIVAHKTGSITNVQHDSGIVYLPDGRSYVLILLSKQLGSNKDGIEVLSLLSKTIYDFVVQ